LFECDQLDQQWVSFPKTLLKMWYCPNSKVNNI
jgi:hypothetical protein